MNVIDLRSDTVTQPTDEMRRAMADAEVGDDGRGEDPTVTRLQEHAAELLGKEAGLFTASGTMGNLVATLTYCHRGDEVILGDQAHIFWSELAGMSALAGAQPRLVPNDSRGRIDPADVEAAIRPDGDLPTALVCLENTHNRCGGQALTPEDTARVCEVAHAAGASVHLDGARIFNASVALEVPAAALVQDVDDVSFCLSKGLSSPVGSVLCGSQEFTHQARKWRKMVGGSMRQAGVLAAAGLVALDTMVDRLAEDHATARQLAQGLANIDGLDLDPESIQTNIVIFHVDPSVATPQEFMGALGREGIRVLSPARQSIRMVTHRHISGADVDDALARVSKVVKQLR
jgi:threonine aldolase